MKDFVPYELALALKELGFDEPCFGYYDIKDNNLQLFSDNLQDASCNSDLKYDDFKHCTAPTFSQAFRWFREKHNIDGLLHKTVEGSYYFWITECEYENYNHYKYYNQMVYFNTYEEAELACLNKLIEIVKTK